MDRTEKLIEQTQRLLKHVEELQQAMKQVQVDLNRHVIVLEKHLTQLATKKSTPQLRPLTTQERRSAPRRKGNPVSVSICDGPDESEPIQGWVLDRSSGGVRLLVDEVIATETLVKIRPSKAPESVPWVTVKVKSCSPQGKSWNLGCQFLEKLSWGDLQRFG